jgi:hypothetical protein
MAVFLYVFLVFSFVVGTKTTSSIWCVVSYGCKSGIANMVLKGRALLRKRLEDGEVNVGHGKEASSIASVHARDRQLHEGRTAYNRGQMGEARAPSARTVHPRRSQDVPSRTQGVRHGLTNNWREEEVRRTFENEFRARSTEKPTLWTPPGKMTRVERTLSLGHGLTNNWKEEEIRRTLEPERRERARSTEKPKWLTPLEQLTPIERIQSLGRGLANNKREEEIRTPLEPERRERVRSTEKLRPSTPTGKMTSTDRTSSSAGYHLTNHWSLEDIRKTFDPERRERARSTEKQRSSTPTPTPTGMVTPTERTRSKGNRLTNNWREEEHRIAPELERRERGMSTEKPRSSTPLGKMTPTEKLRSFDSRKKSTMTTRHTKVVDRARPGVSSPSIHLSSRTARSGSLERKKASLISTKPNNTVEHYFKAIEASRSIERNKQTASSSQQGKSFDLKRRRSEGALLRSSTPASERMTAPFAPDQDEPTPTNTQPVDLTSRFLCTTPQRHEVQSHHHIHSEKKPGLFFAEPNPTGPRIDPPRPTLFSHTKLRVDMETKKIVNKDDPLKSAAEEVVNEDASDISVASSEASSIHLNTWHVRDATRTMPHPKVAAQSSASNAIAEQKQQSGHVMSQSAGPDRNDGHHDTRAAANDARTRFKAKSPVFADYRIPVREATVDRVQVAAPTSGLDTSGSHPDQQSALKSRLLLSKRSFSKSKSTVTGGSIGDHVGGQLDAIKLKREGQGGKDQTGKVSELGTKRAGIMGNHRFENGGFRDFKTAQVAISSAMVAKKEKQSAVAKLHKAGDALVDVIRGTRDRKSTVTYPRPQSKLRTAGDDLCVDIHRKTTAGPQDLQPAMKSNGGSKVEASPVTSATTSLGRETGSPIDVMATLVPKKVHRGWFRRQNYSNTVHCLKVSPVLVSQRQARGSVASSRSSIGSSGYKKGPLLVSRRNDDAALSNGNVQASSIISNQHGDGISYDELKPLTTFDSALHRSGETPDAEFAIVELGEDEDTVTTHSILVNREQVEHQLMHHDQILEDLKLGDENVSGLANSRYSGKRGSSNRKASRPTKKEMKDDASLVDVELTTSFAEQLRHTQMLQKPPFMVPRGAFML